MAPKLQPVRGTHDILPAQMRKHRRIIDTARGVAEVNGFEEVETPIFEKTEVFSRTLGDTSDVVTKEMYTFEDRGGESITLRPEGTAGVARALISNGLQQNLPLKYFYAGPMFRYERPQAGRLRQFTQTGVEYLGDATPWADGIVILTGIEFLQELGLWERCTLEINTLGDGPSRNAYRAALVEYLEKYRDALSPESQARLARNPLRILDSKDDGDRAIIADAPLFSSYLSDDARIFFDMVRSFITLRGISAEVNPHLVRGLDYYCHTAFEITCQELGAQKTVLAGGRYDGLIETMGGPAVPGVGWASGVERLALLLGDQPKPSLVAVIVAGDGAEFVLASKVVDSLRKDKVICEIIGMAKLQKALARANKLNARWAVIIGEQEARQNKYSLKDMESGEQGLVTLDELRNAIRNRQLA
ncbi:MAG TPA: histidine--tRNA ligase [Dongiaceae bacterium]|jgi:histidyl-tRNA synthetase|nr:histidine--tRNA ligase [Dongiaceae bacterium]